MRHRVLLAVGDLSYDQDTVSFWRKWISKSTYSGAWREAVHRSALALKLLTFEPTGDYCIFLSRPSIPSC